MPTSLPLRFPGVDPGTVDVSFEQNLLTIRGSKPRTRDFAGADFDIAKEGELRVYAAERLVGNFERSVRLPEFVDGEKIRAEYNHGVLLLTVPKMDAAQPRKITIRTQETKQIKTRREVYVRA